MKEQLESVVKEIVQCGILYADAVREFEKRLIRSTLEEYKGNQLRSAKALGIHRNTLRRKIEQLGLDGRRRR